MPAKTLSKAPSTTASDGLGDRDLLLGEAGNDYLKGGLGDDYMYGATGNDTYVVDSIHDIVGELSNEGTDLVISSVNFVLYNPGLARSRKPDVTGSAIIGLGNELKKRHPSAPTPTMRSAGSAETITLPVWVAMIR